MSFSTQIKNEILDNNYTNSEVIAELSGFIRNNATINENNVELVTENFKISEVIANYIEEIYKKKAFVETKKYLNFTKKEHYIMTIYDSEHLMQDIGFYDMNNKYLEVVPKYIVGANQEIRSYLRGTFLSQGSVNDPKTSRYHMEMLIDNPQEAVFIQKLLNVFDLNAKILTRNKGYMVYLKESEKISDFLRILGVNKAVMYYEDMRILHERKNQANRLNNCEQANMDKVFNAASEQLKNIEIIEKNMVTRLLDDKTKEALDYRKKYPETSLKDLSEIISVETGKKISKSGLNHRFRKMKETADKYR